jgi:hypothetical protein
VICDIEVCIEIELIVSRVYSKIHTVVRNVKSHVSYSHYRLSKFNIITGCVVSFPLSIARAYWVASEVMCDIEGCIEMELIVSRVYSKIHTVVRNVKSHVSYSHYRLVETLQLTVEGRPVSRFPSLLSTPLVLLRSHLLPIPLGCFLLMALWHSHRVKVRDGEWVGVSDPLGNWHVVID